MWIIIYEDSRVVVTSWFFTTKERAKEYISGLEKQFPVKSRRIAIELMNKD